MTYAAFIHEEAGGKIFLETIIPEFGQGSFRTVSDFTDVFLKGES